MRLSTPEGLGYFIMSIGRMSWDVNKEASGLIRETAVHVGARV